MVDTSRSPEVCIAWLPDILKSDVCSRRNLGLEAIDVFTFITLNHSSRKCRPRSVSDARLREAFETLEQQVHVGRVRYYGINLERVSSGKASAIISISLHSRGAGSPRPEARIDHFRFVQLPFNLAMPRHLPGDIATAMERSRFVHAASQLVSPSWAARALYQGHLTKGMTRIRS